MTIVLVVAAHPDDEVLGCGGTLARHAAEHDEVNVLFLADGETSRDGAGEADVKRRKASAMEACGILGTRSPTFLDLPDNQLDTVPFLEIVKKIEAVITSVRPEIGYTHHGGDLNIDHRIAQNAFLTAARPLPDAPVRAIRCFEIPSSSEWQSPDIEPAFRPNRYTDIENFMETKLKALEAYGSESPAFPHPRSREAVESWARVRGASVGLAAAEAFVSVREIG